MLLSYLQAMRASWHFGGATRAKTPGGAEQGHARALELFSRPDVNPESVVCRPLILLALRGYVRAARELGHTNEALDALDRWRPVCEPWLEAPLTEGEAAILEELYGVGAIR